MSIEAMKQALEASKDECKQYAIEQVQEILEQAISEAAKQEQGESVAFPVTMPWDGNPEKHPQFYTWTWDEFVSGGKWRAEYGWKKPERKVTNLQALYTTPQQRKPLTDEQIETIRQQPQHHKGEFDYEFDELSFARAIEAAHGIKD
jgi:hypothetical protein